MAGLCRAPGEVFMAWNLAKNKNAPAGLKFNFLEF